MIHNDNGGGPNRNYRENANFTVFAPVGITSIVFVGNFFGDPKGLNKFSWSRTKIRVTLYWWVGLPNQPKKQVKKGRKMTKMPISQNSLVVRFSFFFVVTREVICQILAPILDPVIFLGFDPFKSLPS